LNPTSTSLPCRSSGVSTRAVIRPEIRGKVAREARLFGTLGIDDSPADVGRFEPMLRMLRLLALTFWPTMSSRLRRGPLRPSWSFMFEWMIRSLRLDWDETASWPLPQQRASMAAKFYPQPHVRRVTARDEVVADVRVRRFIPARPGATKIVYFHGGSYIYGSTETSHADLCAHLALASSLEVLGVEYRLAPEHVWPAQLDDALAVCRAIAGSPLILAGDSAGGHLAAKVAQAVQATALVLISPWVDLEMPGRSWVENDRYDWGTREVLLRQAHAVAADIPLHSLGLARDPLRALPQTLVVVGGAEALRDDILGFVDTLRAAGVDCSLHVAEEMPHNAPFFEAYHPSAQAAFDAVAAFIRLHAK
jgi:epsilon-lactone hydrolase